MTDKEAMAMALDALIWTTGSGDFSEGGRAHDGAKKCLFPAIAALKEALAQPEQERNFCPRCGKRTKDLTHIHTCTPPREGT